MEIAAALPSTAHVQQWEYAFPVQIAWDHVSDPARAANLDAFVSTYLFRQRVVDQVWAYGTLTTLLRGWKASTNMWDLPAGTVSEYQIAALRDRLEAETPEALTWSAVNGFTTLTTPRPSRRERPLPAVQHVHRMLPLPPPSRSASDAGLPG